MDLWICDTFAEKHAREARARTESASLIENINGRLIPTAEVTSLREQTTKARITEIYLFFKKQIYLLFKKQIYFSYSSFCCLLSQACHLRRWDQSAVNIFYLR